MLHGAPLELRVRLLQRDSPLLFITYFWCSLIISLLVVFPDSANLGLLVVVPASITGSKPSELQALAFLYYRAYRQEVMIKYKRATFIQVIFHFIPSLPSMWVSPASVDTKAERDRIMPLSRPLCAHTNVRCLPPRPPQTTFLVLM